MPRPLSPDNTRAVGIGLAFCLFLGVTQAAAIDSVRVGHSRNIANLAQRWDRLAFEHDGINVNRDSIWLWPVEAHSNIATDLFERGGRIAVIGNGVYSESTDRGHFGQIASQPIPETAYFGETQIAPVPELRALVDGDGTTAFAPNGVDVARQASIHIDLGSVFGIERVRLFPRMDRQHVVDFPQVFEVGSTARRVPIVLDTLGVRAFLPLPRLSFSTQLRNLKPVVDVTFDGTQARMVRINVKEARRWELAEVEIYSDGSVPTGTYTSRAISARSRYPIWGRVLHEGVSAAELSVQIMTATGPTRSPYFYFRKTGIPGRFAAVTEGAYRDLAPDERGPVTRSPSWSSWVPLRDGAVASPGARQFLQFRVVTAQPGTVLRRLTFQYTAEPLVLSLAGEVDPTVVDVGRDTTFVLTLQANTRTESLQNVKSRGFRRLRINTSAAIRQVQRVTVRDRPVSFTARIDPGQGIDLFLPDRVLLDATIIEVQLLGAIYADATLFEVQAQELVFSQGRLDTLYQIAVPTNVDERTPEGTLTVRFAEATELPLLSPIVTAPRLLTPNGDGIGDVVEISFAVTRISEPAPARVTIYSLTGRFVRDIVGADVGAGPHTRDWDGRDHSGRLVPPGLYVARVEVRTDLETAVRATTVAVVY